MDELQDELNDYCDNPPEVDPKLAAKVSSLINKDGTLRKIIKARKSTFVSSIIHLNGQKFDFTGRGYLMPIYDRPDRSILLKTGRQVEKCQTKDSLVHLASGKEKRICDLVPGEQVLGIGASGYQVLDTVVASESNGSQPCLKIKTRLGSVLEVTHNHPLRKLLQWEEARNLKVGDKIASLRTIGEFGSLSHTPVDYSGTLPDEVFSYDRESTRDLICRLWADGGYCKNISGYKLDIGYCSKNLELTRQVQILLRKFGVVTVLEEQKDKKSHLIKLITARSISSFYYNVAPIPGIQFNLPYQLPTSDFDVFPEMEHLNDPTLQKILWRYLDSDTVWDEIVEIEDVGVKETWALQTASQTYLSDFVVNHNTTFLGNNLVISAAVQPYNKALYVSPSHSQTRQFSNEKLKPAIEQSPLIRRYLIDNNVSSQVFEKGFTNGSYIFLRSAFRTADRARGISARELCLDEVQDFLGSEIPVILECTSHFPDSTVLMAGTPKSNDNPIEVYWENTTQNEWMVKCEGCNHWNFLDEKNIAPTELYIDKKISPGPVCKKCQKSINPATGQWMSFSPKKNVQGYRIPQLMVPWIVSTYDQWNKLLWKRDTYPFGQFYNEVLGLSYDHASKPISKDELISICDPNHKMLPDLPTAEDMQYARRFILCGGVDWGEGNDGSDRTPTGKVRAASYSVFTIGTYIDQKRFKVLFAKRYTGQQVDPDFVVKDIARLCQAYDVRIVGADWGHGWGVNNHLIRILGPQRLVQYQYLPKQKERIKWDPIGFKYQVQRNLTISEYFYAMKHGNIIYPNWKEFETFGKDILSVFTEYSEYRREMKYDHRPTDPDDALHSFIYCKLACDLFLGRKPAA
ncbi:MAG: hypothetical protein EBZ49_00225 [Proteobacteria bacterium]|nr:hypothetical protein [Pseudomonadota bacterium]